MVGESRRGVRSLRGRRIGECVFAVGVHFNGHWVR